MPQQPPTLLQILLQELDRLIALARDNNYEAVWFDVEILKDVEEFLWQLQDLQD